MNDFEISIPENIDNGLRFFGMTPIQLLFFLPFLFVGILILIFIPIAYLKILLSSLVIGMSYVLIGQDFDGRNGFKFIMDFIKFSRSEKVIYLTKDNENDQIISLDIEK